jgi:hypothetical protein
MSDLIKQSNALSDLENLLKLFLISFVAHLTLLGLARSPTHEMLESSEKTAGGSRSDGYDARMAGRMECGSRPGRFKGNHMAHKWRGLIFSCFYLYLSVCA